MASAIAPAIGIGTSLIGGIQGKGAAKQQRQLAERQLAQLQPLINAQIASSQFGLDQARGMLPRATNAIETIFNKSTGMFEPLVGDYRSLLEGAQRGQEDLFNRGTGLMGEGQGLLRSSLPYLTGASTALDDLQKFYRPFMFDGQRAIDRFLPSAQRTNQLMAPEFGNINQGFRSASENIARFAPRGGGRVSTLARADIDRQKGLSDAFFQGRQGLGDRALGAAFQGAGGQQNVAQLLQSLGLGQGQLGLGTIGQGLNTINSGTSLLGTKGGLAQNSLAQALQALGIGGQAGESLGRLGLGSLGQGLSGGGQALNLYGQQSSRGFGQPDLFGTGEGLGSYLQKLFSDKGTQSGITDAWHKIFGQPKSSLPKITLGT